MDANIFIYAYFKPKKGKGLSDKIKWCKHEAKEIVKKINEELWNCINRNIGVYSDVILFPAKQK